MSSGNFWVNHYRPSDGETQPATYSLDRDGNPTGPSEHVTLADDYEKGLPWHAGSEESPVRTLTGRRQCSLKAQYCHHRPACKSA